VLKRAFIGRSASAADNACVPTFPPLPLAALLRVWLPSLLLALHGAALADGDGRDHERARAAVQAGEVMPLPQLLQKLQRSHPGQVLELELEREDGRWVYEVKLLQAKGRLVKLAVDAATGEVLVAKRKPEVPRAERER
jgi:hypothetical protein